MKQIKIFNTQKRTKEVFVPLIDKRVSMYVCGVTVYDEAHLGHARAYVAFDIMHRYLKYKGYLVKYVRNVTDIDDKIINRAQLLCATKNEDIKEKVKEITDKYYLSFSQNMDALNVLKPTEEPKATEHIKEIIDIILKLIGNDLAYENKGDVYFKVANFKAYGELSGRKLEDLEAGARVDVNENKNNPLDFVLWKKAKEGEPSWNSPWGEGRPGWHIECSAMSTKYLGESFDIHGGGEDLIFPHHENEKAQSEGAFNKPFVKYWVHNGFVTIDKEKMSKSLGNFFTLHDIFEKFEPRVVRLFLISKKYRSPLDFSYVALEGAKESMRRIDNCVGMFKQYLQEQALVNDNKELDDSLMELFTAGMDDDFNTSVALALVFDIVSEINICLKEKIIEQLHVKKFNTLLKICDILGIECQAIQIKKVDSIQSVILTAEQIDDLLARDVFENSEIESLITARNIARKEKKFSLGDKIRNSLAEKGIILRDTKEGTGWNKD